MGRTDTQQENVTAVRRIYAALSDGDIERALQSVTEAFENDWSRSIGPYQGVYRGREETRTLWSGFTEAVDGASFEVDDTREVGPHVLAFVRVRIRGRGSGAEVVGRGPHLWTFEQGEAIRFELFQERAEALAVLGLHE